MPVFNQNIAINLICAENSESQLIEKNEKSNNRGLKGWYESAITDLSKAVLSFLFNFCILNFQLIQFSCQSKSYPLCKLFTSAICIKSFNHGNVNSDRCFLVIRHHSVPGETSLLSQ